ncbi:MAG: polyphosphate polymerase domain-containing protein [Erysipelotrichaceae bacterium]|nr:polyphosphate polymerase domain-containing protein [Erysipelotrichaceae bacterium]
MIRSSLDHPAYKEKVRLRSYTTVKNDSDPVFLELKKKYLGVTYKRRQEMTYREAMNYIQFGTLPCSSQIMKEIDHVCRKQYELSPKVLISYSRDSFAAKDHDVRITFDHDIRFSLGNLSMKNENREKRLTDDEVIMEVKTITSMPMWLVTALDSLHIYPSNFSKYGQIYQKYLMKGVQTCHSYYSIPYSRPHLTAPLSSFAPQHP